MILITNSVRHYLRIDGATQQALEELCRARVCTKAELLRRYVQEGALRDAAQYGAQIEEVTRLVEVLQAHD
jgi:hypothetical protein